MKNTLLALAFVASTGLYFFSSNYNSPSESEEYLAKSRISTILTIALSDDEALQDLIIDSGMIDENIFINELVDKGNSMYANAHFMNDADCYQIELEWEKDKLFTDENRTVMLNVGC